MSVKKKICNLVVGGGDGQNIAADGPADAPDRAAEVVDGLVLLLVEDAMFI